MNRQDILVSKGTDLAVQHSLARNAGTKLALDWFDDIAVNRSATERRAATLTTRSFTNTSTARRSTAWRRHSSAPAFPSAVALWATG